MRVVGMFIQGRLVDMIFILYAEREEAVDICRNCNDVIIWKPEVIIAIEDSGKLFEEAE
ncbi:hypothetical protein D3C71_1364170 [compost metagenome]